MPVCCIGSCLHSCIVSKTDGKNGGGGNMNPYKNYRMVACCSTKLCVCSEVNSLCLMVLIPIYMSINWSISEIAPKTGKDSFKGL